MNRQNRGSQRDSELEANAKRAIKTTFVGSIAEVEKQLGYIWGKGKKESELTDSEKYFFDLWQILRNNIMDLGNKQCRIIEKEFGKFSVKYVGEIQYFQFKPRGNNG